jgi:hypothetical protein
LSLQSEGELFLDNDFDELSLVDSSLDSQEKSRLDNIMTYDEVERDENESVWKGGSKEDNTEQISDKDRKSKYSHQTDVQAQDCDLITGKLSQDPLRTCQTSEDSTFCSTPFSLKYSSWRCLCLIGREKVDFLSLLGEESDHSIIVKAILSYLEPVDLTAVAVVSKTWNRVCTADYDARRRISCYVENKQKNKENWQHFQVCRQRLT